MTSSPIADQRLSRTREAIELAFDDEKPIFLAFSGGKDALALLKLCEPYAGRFKLIWANTGHSFPHVERLIRAEGERFGLEEIRPDLHAHWQAHGWPTEIATVTSAMSVNSDIRLQPWPLCCLAMKVAPILAHLGALKTPVTLLHGQKLADGWRVPLPMPPNVSISMPLAEWTDADIYSFLSAEGVELPEHYATVKDSLDCRICPANWTQSFAPEYVEYINRKYPEVSRSVRPVAERIFKHLRSATSNLETALERAAQD